MKASIAEYHCQSFSLFLTRAGSQVGTVNDWVFPQSQLHLFHYAFYQEDKFLVEDIVDGLIFPSSTGSIPCYRRWPLQSPYYPLARIHRLPFASPLLFLQIVSEITPTPIFILIYSPLLASSSHLISIPVPFLTSFLPVSCVCPPQINTASQ